MLQGRAHPSCAIVAVCYTTRTRPIIWSLQHGSETLFWINSPHQCCGEVKRGVSQKPTTRPARYQAGTYTCRGVWPPTRKGDNGPRSNVIVSKMNEAIAISPEVANLFILWGESEKRAKSGNCLSVERSRSELDSLRPTAQISLPLSHKECQDRQQQQPHVYIH